MTRDEWLLVALVDGEASTSEIAELTEIPDRTCRKGLRKLERGGYVWSPERGTWRLTKRGRGRSPPSSRNRMWALAGGAWARISGYLATFRIAAMTTLRLTHASLNFWIEPRLRVLNDRWLAVVDLASEPQIGLGDTAGQAVLGSALIVSPHA